MTLKDYRDIAERAKAKQDAMFRSLIACLKVQLKQGMAPIAYDVAATSWTSMPAQVDFWVHTWSSAAIKAQEAEEQYLHMKRVWQRGIKS